MNKYSFSSRVLGRTKTYLNFINDRWTKYVNHEMSRDEATQIKRRVIAQNGNKVIDRNLKKKIKYYCKHTFGSSSYWPWIALYTELRGEFCDGWVPEDYYRFNILSRMNPEKFKKLSEAKTIDHKLFEDSIIGPLVLRSNGQYCNGNGVVKTKSEVQCLLNSLNEEIIIKPDGGRGGDKIFFRHTSDLCLEELPSNTDLLFQRVVSQHPELNKLYPHSVNTFRVLTYLTQDGDVEVKFVIVRFGIGGTRIDNASKGGGWIFVQPGGKVQPKAYDGDGLTIGDVHPDTGFRYTDLKLPFLPEIITLCKKTHQSFPYTRIIGWDVFVDRSGEPKLIEWNANNPFFGAIEAHFGPFFGELL